MAQAVRVQSPMVGESPLGEHSVAFSPCTYVDSVCRSVPRRRPEQDRMVRARLTAIGHCFSFIPCCIPDRGGRFVGICQRDRRSGLQSNNDPGRHNAPGGSPGALGPPDPCAPEDRRGRREGVEVRPTSHCEALNSSCGRRDAGVIIARARRTGVQIRISVIYNAY